MYFATILVISYFPYGELLFLILDITAALGYYFLNSSFFHPNSSTLCVNTLLIVPISTCLNFLVNLSNSPKFFSSSLSYRTSISKMSSWYLKVSTVPIKILTLVFSSHYFFACGDWWNGLVGKIFHTKFDDLNSLPRPHIHMEGMRSFIALSWPLHVCYDFCCPPPTLSYVSE